MDDDIEAAAPAMTLEPQDGAAEPGAETGAEAGAEHGRDGAEERAAAELGPGPGADLDDEELERRVAALVFASPEPLSVARLVLLLERPPAARVEAALLALGDRLERAGLPLRVFGLKGGYTLATTEAMAEVVTRLAKGSTVEKVSPAALETLAVIAYRQPVTKAEIEAIRGVQAGPILRSLVDRGLARVVGRADLPGHPLQYGTTKEFLDRFGLMSLKELPRDSELARD